MAASKKRLNPRFFLCFIHPRICFFSDIQSILSSHISMKVWEKCRKNDDGSYTNYSKPLIVVVGRIPKKGICHIGYLRISRVVCTYRRACGHVDVGTCPHKVLAATLTLFQPGVGRLCPPYTVVPTKF
jgi:hypothetical protein